MMARLADALSALTSLGDLHLIEAPEAWTQGRTLYVGMTAVRVAGFRLLEAVPTR